MLFCLPSVGSVSGFQMDPGKSRAFLALAMDIAKAIHF
jgi:hypothetical protein